MATGTRLQQPANQHISQTRLGIPAVHRYIGEEDSFAFEEGKGCRAKYQVTLQLGFNYSPCLQRETPSRA